MGHYDNCREGNCSVCGQAEGYCEHTKKSKVKKPVQEQMPLASANDRQVGGNHYKKHVMDHWDTVVLFELDYFQGNIWKYLWRWRDKAGLVDLEKALHYLQKYIEIEQLRAKGELTNGIMLLAMQKLEQMDAEAQQAASYKAEAKGDDPAGDMLQYGIAVYACVHGKKISAESSKDEFCSKCQELTQNTAMRIVSRHPPFDPDSEGLDP